MAQTSPNFAAQYGKWLVSRISTSIREGVTEVSTPLLDPLNDGMRIFIEPTPNGYLLHDGGLTLETLSLYGVDVHATEHRRNLSETVLRTCGLMMADERIQTTANEGNLPQRMHFLLSGMHRISDLWLTVRPSGGRDFFERVCRYLDEREVLYSTNLTIPGQTVDHPMDIVIPLPKRGERLIKLIGTPNPNSAKVVSFSWIEIQKIRPTAERVILLNDESSDEEKEIRRISEQTAAILKGYSTAVYGWSKRFEKSFESFWKAA